MLRKMCRCCDRRHNWEAYIRRERTGKVLKRIPEGNRIKTIIQCTRCGRTWSYSRRIKH